jgi:hypothetical protein
MNSYEYLFLDPSEIKQFNDSYEYCCDDDGIISFESLKEIVLSYPKYEKSLSISKLNLFHKKIKESTLQYGEKEFYISKHLLN